MAGVHAAISAVSSTLLKKGGFNPGLTARVFFVLRARPVHRRAITF